MTALMERTGTTREELHAGVMAIYTAAKAMLDEGRQPHLSLTEQSETLSLRQLRFLHGPVFGQIAEQVFVNGQQFDKKTWKRYLKERFIPDEFEMVEPAFVKDRKTGAWRPSKAKGPVPRKKEKSLLDLKNEARSNFIDEVLAYAATELAVVFLFTFDEREAVRYVAPRSRQRKAAQPQAAEEAQPA